MDKQTIEQLKLALLQKKETLEKELKNFATQDAHDKNDWESTYPRVPEGNIEEAADEVEQYSTNLPIESSLETQLANVNAVLEQIEQGTYQGTCKQCGMDIEQERLAVVPEANTCKACAKK